MALNYFFFVTVTLRVLLYYFGYDWAHVYLKGNLFSKKKKRRNKKTEFVFVAKRFVIHKPINRIDCTQPLCLL